MTQACINTAQLQRVVEGVDIKALFLGLLYNAAYNYIRLAPIRSAKAVCLLASGTPPAKDAVGSCKFSTRCQRVPRSHAMHYCLLRASPTT